MGTRDLPDIRPVNFIVAQTVRPKLRQALPFIPIQLLLKTHSKKPNLLGHAHIQQFKGACQLL